MSISIPDADWVPPQWEDEHRSPILIHFESMAEISSRNDIFPFVTHAPKFRTCMRYHRERFEGLAFFSAYCDIDGHADRGGVAAMIDNVLGVFTMTYHDSMCYTRNLECVYYDFVPLETNVQVTCFVLGKENNRVSVRCQVIDAQNKVLVSSTGVFSLVPILMIDGKPMMKVWKQPPNVPIGNRPKNWIIDFRNPFALLADDLAADWISKGMRRIPVLNELNSFDFGFAQKMTSDIFSDAVAVAGIIYFSKYTCGPPGRVNGGAIIAAFEHLFMHAVCHFQMELLPKIQVRFIKGVPYNCLCSISVERMEDSLLSASLRIQQSPGTSWNEADTVVAVTGTMLLNSSSKL